MEYFKIEQQDAVQIWRTHNPPMNYLKAPMTQELTQLIAKVESDEKTCALILTGGIEGKFITHYSVDELAQAAADPAECARSFPALEEGFNRMLNRLMLMPKAAYARRTPDSHGCLHSGRGPRPYGGT
jgi:enoyl-CoA hydratase/carnithine racemase